MPIVYGICIIFSGKLAIQDMWLAEFNKKMIRNNFISPPFYSVFNRYYES